MTDAQVPPRTDHLPVRASWRHRLAYVAFRGLLGLVRGLPTRWVTGSGAALLATVGPWLRQHRRALANLAIAFPEKSDAQRRAIARAMWANMGRTYAEMLILDRLDADAACVTLADEGRWRATLAAPDTVICCTPHIGSWELAVKPLRDMGRHPAGVYRPLANPLLDRWLVATRSSLFPGGLLAKGDNDDDTRTGQRTARRLIDMARKGATICFVTDHFDRRSDPVPFMGRQARFTTVPAMIARHVGARVLIGRCLRLGTQSRFAMQIIELDVPRNGDRASDAKALTEAIFAHFEAWIRETPEQWMWWNTRWVKPD